MEPEDRPLLGTIMDGKDVYTIRRGKYYPVEVMYNRLRDPVGYVTDYEVRIAMARMVPNVCLRREYIAMLAARHFRLRQALGELIRTPDPDRVIHIDHLYIGTPSLGAPSA